MEALSVILQVGYFKWTGGKRIFLMAPLHHHFERRDGLNLCYSFLDYCFGDGAFIGLFFPL